jgi:hypothetical protein
MNRRAPGILKDWIWVRTQLFDRGPANGRNRRFSVTQRLHLERLFLPLSGPCRSRPSRSPEGRNGAFSRHQIDSPDPQCVNAQCCRSVAAPKPVMPR